MAPTIALLAIDAEPNNCPLGDPLELKLVFKTDEAIAGARWDIKYMVDFASKRQIVELGSSEKVDYEVGEHPFEIKIDAIDFTGVNKSLLKNVGLLLACLVAPDGQEIVQISMVTQVTKKKGEEGLTRTIMSPLE
mmetsp:Transcript_22122/g.48555  ORF Transcript_22122/g.48555 Transcript_22122/m.48555 type:complete len:135 (+) Transcript_22122:92-496(+)